MTNIGNLFITCIVDTLYPDIGEAVFRVLEKAGVDVHFPTGQTCCGQPAFNAGLRDQARPIAQHTIRVFEEVDGPVIVPSGSCTAMIRHGYKELFIGDTEWLPRAQALAERTYELTEYLVDKLNVVNLGSRYPGVVTYHPSCHQLRDLGVVRQPHALLEAVQDIEIVELPNAGDCCGFGGVFSIEQPEISGAMLDRKIENIEQTGAPLVVSCDAGCMTNINGGLHRQGKLPHVVHIAQILEKS